MKILNATLVLLLGSLLGARAQVPTTATVSAPTDYQVVQQDGNSRVWQRETYKAGPNGEIVTNRQTYTELATGLNFQDTNGQFQASQEEIDLQPDGTAAAIRGQHKAFFPPDILNGEIELITPAGRELKSQPAALAYDDGTNMVLIAVLTNSVGQIINGNQVIYTNAFAGLDADLMYTYRRSGFEQDVVLHQQPPAPESLGLNAATTRLQVLTEFFNPPTPIQTTCTLPEQSGMALTDDTLDFGQMQMVPGKAFMLGTNAPSTRVGKSWMMLDGRRFLVETVPLMALATEFESLPVSPSSTVARIKPRVPSGKRMLPSPYFAKANGHRLQLAKAGFNWQRGLVLDYNTINTSLTNYTFQGNSTYYISGAANLYGTNTFEGGTVIKYASGASITLENTNVIWKSGPYRPVIFTAKDDNTVGQMITGSTGSPGNNYANPALKFAALTTSTVISNFRISFASQAIYVGGENYRFYNGQIVNCQNGLTFPGPGEAGMTFLGNVLFANDATNFNNLIQCTFDVQNCTFNSSAYLATFPASPVDPVNLEFTNCLFFNVAAFTNSNSGVRLVGGNDAFGKNTFGNVPVFGANYTSFTDIPFSAIGGGGNYLQTNNIYSGTASIDATLLASLSNKTVYPPLVYSNVVITNGLTLSPRAPRDTNAAPIIGYHYDPIDYFVDLLAVTNCTLTISNGAVLAYDNSGAAIWMQDGASIRSIGTPATPNWFVHYTCAQEEPVLIGTNGTSGSFYTGIVIYTHFTTIPIQNALFQFTQFTIPAGATGYDFYDSGSWSLVNLLIQDCELGNNENEIDGLSAGFNASAMIQNNLFNGSILFSSSGATTNFSLSVSNNLFFNTTVELIPAVSSNIWCFYDNDFDSSTVICGVRTKQNTANGYNAYLNCTGSLNPTNATDIFSSNSLAYETGFLGTFYQPANSPLIAAGSTTANLAGLYYFTTQTNQTPQADLPVDIGYHYVATDAYGNPLATFNDGIPDYSDDPNGNGLPNWWELEFFGNTDETATNLDNAGNTLLYDYQNGLDPIVTSFALSVTNDYVNNANVPVQLAVTNGVPREYSVLINATNLNAAIWQPLVSTNLNVYLGATDGTYNVMVGLRDSAEDNEPVWQDVLLTLDTTPPVIIVTNPVAGTISQPIIQVQGFANELLSRITFDVSNAAGIFTNETGYATGQYYDTNLMAYTTNWFQGYDVAVTNGYNVITLHAFDLANNETTVAYDYTVVYSTNPPVLSLIWPQPNALIGGSNFTLQATVNDATAKVVASITDTNGDTSTVMALVERNGNIWVSNLPLATGTNVVTLTATNTAGIVNAINFKVVQSVVNLTVDPISNAQFNQSFVTVTGTVMPGQNVYVNGTQATVDVSGNWTAINVSVSPTGTANLSVQAENAAGIVDSAQSLNQQEPSLIQVASYESEAKFLQNSVNYCFPVTKGFVYILNTGEWAIGIGGFTQSITQSSGDSVKNDTYPWSVDSPPLPPWPFAQVSQTSYSFIPSGGDCGPNIPDSYAYTSTTVAKTLLQLVPGGLATSGNHLVRLLMTATDASGNTLAPDTFHLLGQTFTPTATNADVGEMFTVVASGATPSFAPTVSGQNQGNFTVQADDVSLQSLTVVSNSATQIDATNWAVVKSPVTNNFVIVQANLNYTNAAILAQAAKAIQWTGGQPVPGNPLQREISTATSAKTAITASLGSTPTSLNIWVIWANLTCKITGTLDPDDKAAILVNGDWPSVNSWNISLDGFGNNGLGGGNELGAIDCLSNTNLSYDYAIGKMEAKAILQPIGIGKILNSTNNWYIRRVLIGLAYNSGVKEYTSPTNGEDDTSQRFSEYFDSSAGLAFDSDCPGCPIYGNGTNVAGTAEVYDNFYEYMTVNFGNGNVVCSGTNTYSYEAQIDVGATNKIQLNSISTSLITLPTGPYYSH